MPDIWSSRTQPKVERVKLTARVSLEAYDSITELQRRHRRQTGHSGRSWMQPLELMQETTHPEPDFHRPRFSTIDDMLDLDRKLVEGLNKLGERKYPLDVRRGVKNMVERSDRKGEMLKTPSKTYFFDIKETRDLNPEPTD